MDMIGIVVFAGFVWVGVVPAAQWPLTWQAQNRIGAWENAQEDAERSKPRTLAEYRASIESSTSLTPDQKKLLIESEEFIVRMEERSEREHREFLEQLERDHQATMERLRKYKLEMEKNPPPKPTRKFLQ